ncbi:MAG: hypothetical protein II301_07200 [Peptococcaceae bacterium]|jgi:hypothetical protein|nr:hypothetical protein [Peptococcaceae bacterium]MBQ2021541.1 hypothetical protein [Peptococcaceae bacterium]MBQ2369883.1 hypothetical protein [Peptococcaceae bacterium]MBQ2432017.1 hypothetical protein [Peptococcaceae bacterium]MBQ5658646.1 hypothetical protein [Peptococcaceae bacterium]
MNDTILAAVTTDEYADKVQGSVAVFIADDEAEQQRTAMLLARIMRGMSHDLENGVMIVVRH